MHGKSQISHIQGSVQGYPAIHFFVHAQTEICGCDTINAF